MKEVLLHFLEDLMSVFMENILEHYLVLLVLFLIKNIPKFIDSTIFNPKNKKEKLKFMGEKNPINVIE